MPRSLRLAFRASLLLLAPGLACPAYCPAQYASPQTAQRPRRLVPVIRAAPQVQAPRDLAPPVEYVPAVPRQRIAVREVPAPGPEAAWEVTGYRQPPFGRCKVKLGRWLIRKGSPRPVLEFYEAPTEGAAVRVIYEQPVAQAAPQQVEYVEVEEEQPVLAPRDLPPAKAPPLAAPRTVPPKARPRSAPIEPRPNPAPARKRSLPSPQEPGDLAPPPPPAPEPPADGIGEPTPAEPVESEARAGEWWRLW